MYRDVKDQISDLINRNIINFDTETPARGVRDIFGEGRLGSIKYQLASIKARLNIAYELQQVHGVNNVLIISFEDLVNNYNAEKQRIEKFLGLDESCHLLKRTKFIPEQSALNIGIYKNVLTTQEIELIDKMGVK